MERSRDHVPAAPGRGPVLSPGDPLARAAGLLAARDRPLLPVVDGEGRLAGTLSREDLAAFLREAALLGGEAAEEALRAARVEEAMDRRPVTALPGDGEEGARALMERYALPAVAVTDGAGAFLRLLPRRAAPLPRRSPPLPGTPPRP